jgi:hypothetical protein
MRESWFDLSEWQRMAYDERRVRLEHIALSVVGFSMRSETASLCLVHTPSDLAFSFVPRATFEAGLTEHDVAVLQTMLGLCDHDLAEIARACAPRARRTAGPLLLTTRPLSSDDNARLSAGACDHDTPARSVARELAARSGFRLPTDVEVELVRRDGGSRSFFVELGDGPARELRSSFGLKRLHLAEWTDDHASGWRPGVYLPLQSDDEIPLTLAALRAEAEGSEDVPDCVARWAVDLTDVVRQASPIGEA